MILDMRWRYFKHSPLEDEFRSGPQNRHEESKFQSCIPNIVSILLCRNPHQHDLMKVVLNMDKIPLKPSDPYFQGTYNRFMNFNTYLLQVIHMNLVPFFYHSKAGLLIDSHIYYLMNFE